MKNSEALAEIRKGIQKAIDENGWKFQLRPFNVEAECVTWVQAIDVTNTPVAPRSCQLIKGGRKIHPDNNGCLSNIPLRIEVAVKRLKEYAKKIDMQKLTS